MAPQLRHVVPKNLAVHRQDPFLRGGARVQQWLFASAQPQKSSKVRGASRRAPAREAASFIREDPLQRGSCRLWLFFSW